MSHRPCSFYLKILTGILFLTGFVLLIANYLPRAVDWEETFYLVGQAVYHGKSPYIVEGFLNPPWAALAVIPFAWLPEKIGRAAFLVASLLAFGVVAFKMGAKPFAFLAFLLSPPVIHCLLNANIDFLPLLGFVLPPPVGIFFVVIKPQVGFCIAIFWVVQCLRAREWKNLFFLLAPLSVATLLSFALFGFWPTRLLGSASFYWNSSFWPLSIPIGLALIVVAIRKKAVKPAMAASPFLSPYLAFHSWSGPLVALSGDQLAMGAAVAGLWIAVILRSIS